MSRFLRGLARRCERLRQAAERLAERRRPVSDYPIEDHAGPVTAVETYWTGHTVNDVPFLSAAGSLRYLEWRSREYPRFHELAGLWGDGAGRTILDYGCGPGNDLVGLLEFARAGRVIGMDVSPVALDLARHRLSLHGFDPERIRLVRLSDAEPRIPLTDSSVDVVQCFGVLHHTSYPSALLAELARVVRPGGEVRIMVYNRDSVWFHLYVPYVRQLLGGIDADRPVEDAFRRSTDGEDCPVAVAYPPAAFLDVARSVGLEGTFAGGYYAQMELDLYRRYSGAAAHDGRLAPEHRAFLAGLTLDDRHRPLIAGLAAGIGGTYRLVRARSGAATNISE